MVLIFQKGRKRKDTVLSKFFAHYSNLMRITSSHQIISSQSVAKGWGFLTEVCIS